MADPSTTRLCARIGEITSTAASAVVRDERIAWVQARREALFPGSAFSESAEIPADPLGVLRKIAADDQAVGWIGATLNYTHQNWRSTGLFSVSGQSSVEIRQVGAPNPREAEVIVSSATSTVLLRRTDPAVWIPAPRLIAAPTELAAPGSAVALLGIDAIEPIAETDRGGRSYKRYTSMPHEQSAGVESNAVTRHLCYPVSNAAFVIDLWTDDLERVTRIRLITSDGNRWSEIAFLRGLDTVPDLPSNPLTTSDPVGSEWAGIEALDPIAVPLRVALDPIGRPYDVVPRPGVSIRHDDAGTLHATDGTVIVLDGNVLEVDPTRESYSTVDFGVPTELLVTVIREVAPSGEAVLGIRLDRPSTTVERWGPLESGYGTDGGVGAITSGAVLAEAHRRGDTSLSHTLQTLTDAVLDSPTADLLVTDLLGSDRMDTIYFQNGRGDGGFPMTRGFDSDDRVVAVYVFDLRYPFRLAIPDGTPPTDITERENQFIECMEGHRPVLQDGSCPTDEQLGNP